MLFEPLRCFRRNLCTGRWTKYFHRVEFERMSFHSTRAEAHDDLNAKRVPFPKAGRTVRARKVCKIICFFLASFTDIVWLARNFSYVERSVQQANKIIPWEANSPS